ncbi:MAG: hypothetical protein Q8N81_06075, partial [bacterium]|nr:hypothetical protein [bacterium]
MKRIVLIGVIIAILLIGVAVYFFFFGGSKLLTQTNNKTPSQGQQPPPPVAGLPGLTKISDRSALVPIMALDQKAVWYFDRVGGLYHNQLNGSQEEQYGLPEISPIESVLWPDNGNDFILRLSSSGENRVFRYFDSYAKTFVDLPRNVEDLAWMPDGKKILYIWVRDDGRRELKLARPDTSDYSKIADLDADYALTVSPSGQLALLRERSASGSVAKVFKVDLVTGAVSTLLDRGLNLEVKFLPDPQKLLFTRANASTNLPEVWLYDFTAGTFENLGIATSLDKVARSSSGTLFYYG